MIADHRYLENYISVFNSLPLGGVWLDVKWQGGVYTPNKLLNPTLPRPRAGIAQG